MENLLLPSKLKFEDDKKDKNKSTLTIEPLYFGYGTTLGNSLRRVLLSSLPGAAVTSVKIDGADQEFQNINDVKEDALEICLNLKKLRLRVHSQEPVKLTLSVKGNKMATAADFDKNADIDVANKVVIIKIQGELTAGKTADVDVSIVRDNLNNKDALVVNVSKNQLTSKEYSITEAKGSNKEEIETNVFSENIGQLKFDYPELLNESGIKLSSKLLQELGQSKLENEKNNEYIPRIRDSALALLGLDDDS